MDCVELVALATEYLEDALPAAERERVEAHVRECDGCEAHLAQLRAAIEVAGELAPERLPEARIAAILRAIG
jgi:anti-sigma factor RsiW